MTGGEEEQMLTDPKIVDRNPQPYAAMVLKLRQPEISGTAPQLIGEVVQWVLAKGGQLTGPPIFNYTGFFPGGEMEMQVAMPTDRVLDPEGRFSTGTIPGGRFASLTATADYSDLYDANMKLDDWARKQGFKLDGEPMGDSFVNANRLEIYHKDPGEDPSCLPVTEVAFRLKD